MNFTTSNTSSCYISMSLNSLQTGFNVNLSSWHKMVKCNAARHEIPRIEWLWLKCRSYAVISPSVLMKVYILMLKCQVIWCSKKINSSRTISLQFKQQPSHINVHTLKLLFFEAPNGFITALSLCGWSLLIRQILTWQDFTAVVGKSTPDVSDYENNLCTALPQITSQMLETQLDPGLDSAG